MGLFKQKMKITCVGPPLTIYSVYVQLLKKEKFNFQIEILFL